MPDPQLRHARVVNRSSSWWRQNRPDNFVKKMTALLGCVAGCLSSNIYFDESVLKLTKPSVMYVSKPKPSTCFHVALSWRRPRRVKSL